METPLNCQIRERRQRFFRIAVHTLPFVALAAIAIFYQKH